MTEQEILSNLCAYDDRNPNRVDGDLIPGDRIQKDPNQICHCDNCFYGRTRMAEEILRTRESLAFMVRVAGGKIQDKTKLIELRFEADTLKTWFKSAQQILKT